MALTWSKKHTSNRVGHKFENGKVVAHKIYKDYIQRGDITKRDKILNAKLKYIGQAIVTGHIHMTDDQIAKTIIYNQ